MSVATLYSKLSVVKSSIDRYDHIDQASLLTRDERDRTMKAYRLICFHHLRSLIDEATVEMVKAAPNDVKEIERIVEIAVTMAKVENVKVN